MLPERLDEFITVLQDRGYVLFPPESIDDPLVEDGPIVLLTRGEDGAGDQFALLRNDVDEWLICLRFGTTAWPVAEVVRVLRNGEMRVESPPMALEEQVDTALRLLDLLSADPATVAQLTKLFAPEAEDPALEGRGNDPCWCGSGLKLKRCHATLPPYREQSSVA